MSAFVQGRAHRLLIFGLHSPGAGLTHVIERLCGEIGDALAIDYVGFVPSGGVAGGLQARLPCNVHLHRCRGPTFGLRAGTLHDYFTRLEPDVALVMGPIFLVDSLLRMLQAYRGKARIVLYLPIEGELTDQSALNTIALADACILYTECARRNVRTLWSVARDEGRPDNAPPLFVLGHGVDCGVFKPLDSGVEAHFADAGRAAVRRWLFSGDPALDNEFIVLNANRAYYRKRLDLTIAGFAQFAARRRGAVLYLHVPGLRPDERRRLEQAIVAAQIGDRVWLNRLNPDGGVLPLETLNNLYNACDVGVTTAMGEGWGLGTFEHAATGAPQIVPDHTSFAENWRGSAAMIPVSSQQFVFYEFTTMFEVAPEAVAAVLEQFYASRPYRRHMALAAHSRATEPRFSWPRIAGDLAVMLREIVASPR